ncbi:hypothetical protein TrVE_jg8828 [Triparma verrucosa]|uniref:Uncharacterized protein n=1 Tax=Triparma verrucosa TaxID=1606542 RepID=A0A9W7FPD0_9STRA|nr:hypothetical protein TrVE_jg8828 [Triparma verrucosa]
MLTDDFRRLLRQYIFFKDLVNTMRLVTKDWQRIAEELIDESVESGVLLIHDGKDRKSSFKKKQRLVTQVVFLLNITKVGKYVCCAAANLKAEAEIEELRAQVAELKETVVYLQNAVIAANKRNQGPDSRGSMLKM